MVGQVTDEKVSILLKWKTAFYDIKKKTQKEAPTQKYSLNKLRLVWGMLFFNRDFNPPACHKIIIIVLLRPCLCKKSIFQRKFFCALNFEVPKVSQWYRCNIAFHFLKGNLDAILLFNESVQNKRERW